MPCLCRYLEKIILAAINNLLDLSIWHLVSDNNIYKNAGFPDNKKARAADVSKFGRAVSTFYME